MGSEMCIRDSRLVVLAGCDTGSGRSSSSDGLQSIARSFLAAGVPAVVASTAPVNDAAAGPFFLEVHRRFLRGEPIAQALRDAQLTFLRSPNATLRFPASWAQFQVLGAS